MESYSYNLIDEPWIPVVSLDGKTGLVSLRTLLRDAHTVARISASLPHSNAAILRLLLAILHRNFGPRNEEAWADLWQSGAFDKAALDAYWGKFKDRFDLFAEKHRFFQNRHPQRELKPANDLLFMVGGGDADTLFDHHIDTAPITLSPAQAAQLLLTTQSYGLAGLCHPQLGLVYTDGSCSRAPVFFLQGDTLFQTLMLNLVQYNRSTPIQWENRDDPPAWEMDDPYHAGRTIPDGYLDYLTWQNRRVYLQPGMENGEVVVQQVVLAPGLRLSEEQLNPMHHYWYDKKGERKVIRFSEGRALWRDSSSFLSFDRQKQEAPHALGWVRTLIEHELLPAQRLRLVAYGMSTEPGKQKIYFYRGEQFSFASNLLTDPNRVNALTRALDWAKDTDHQLWGALNTSAGLILSETANLEEGHKPDPKDVGNLLTHWQAENTYWAGLEFPFYAFLDALAADPALALASWQQTLRHTAQNCFDQVMEQQCGADRRSLKAAAIGSNQLRAGLKKVFPAVSAEGQPA